MPIVDVLIGVLVVAAAVAGTTRGLVRAAPLAGFAVGAVLGSRLPLVLGLELDSEFSLAAALPAAIVLGAVLAALVERRAGRVSRFARRHPRANVAGGGAIAAAAAVVAAWLLAPVVTELEFVRDPVERSDALAALNSVLEPAGPERPEELPPVVNLPRFEGRLPRIGGVNRDAVSDRDVLIAERSVVKVRVVGCNGKGTGSGWIAADGVVVTNAHVVTQSEALSVQVRGRGPQLPAVPIWFDGANDLALLRVPGVRDLPPLRIVASPRAGTVAATLGFPLGRRRIWPARIGPTTSRVVGRIGGGESPGVSDTITGRLVTTVRGMGLPGNSGGPVVDRQGRVLTTTFAGTPGRGFLGVPNRFVRTALAKAGPRVSTGRCGED